MLIKILIGLLIFFFVVIVFLVMAIFSIAEGIANVINASSKR